MAEMSEGSLIVLAASTLLLIGLIIAIAKVLSWRTTVGANEACIVYQGPHVWIFSGSNSYPDEKGKMVPWETDSQNPAIYRGAIFYAFPKWLPVIGRGIIRVPLSDIEVDFPEEVITPVQGGARAGVLGLTVIFRVKNPMTAAVSWAANGIPAMISVMRELIIASLRKATFAMATGSVIENTADVAKQVRGTIEDDAENRGLLIASVGFSGLDDVPDSTAVSDFYTMQEAVIEADRKVRRAEQNRRSRVRSAEEEEAASIREAAQREKTAMANALAILAEVEAQRAEQVGTANITRDVAFATGPELEARGITVKGSAEAAMKTLLAEALGKLSAEGREWVKLMVQEKIGVTGAEALKGANLTLAGPPSSLYELLGVQGGASLRAMADAMAGKAGKGGMEFLAEVLGLIKKGDAPAQTRAD